MYELKTSGGYPIDEASSALQKCLRRGMVKDAMFWALELNSTFPDYVWRRLAVIAAEDIGPANPELVGTIAAYASLVPVMRKASTKKTYDPAILGFAILMMATSPKSRQADNLVNEVLREMRLERESGVQREVPDFALDMHTGRGRQMGRDIKCFWQDGAKLANEIPPQQLGLGDGFVGWSDEHGDGYHDADSKKVDPWKNAGKEDDHQG